MTMKPLDAEVSAHRPPSTIETEMNQISALLAHPGWHMMREALLREERAALRLLYDPARSSTEDLNFNRATARSISTMLNLPQFMLEQLRSEHELSAKYESFKQER